MAYMRDSKGRRLDAFEVADRVETVAFNYPLSEFDAAVRVAEAGGAQAHIICVGDSVTMGAEAGTQDLYLANGWVGQFRAMIASRYGDAGTGIVHMVDTIVPGIRDGRHAFTGTWANAAYGAFNLACKSATSSATYTFTPGIECDSFILYYAKRADGGAGSVRVNSGTPVTVDHVGANTYATETITVAKASNHVLTYTAPASGQGYLLAVEARNSEGKVRVTQVARGGNTTASVISDSSGIASQKVVFDMADPDLSIIFLGINREVSATYETNLTTLATKAKTFGSVMFVAPYKDGIVAPTTTSAQVYASMTKVAETKNIPVVDLFNKWSTYDVMNAAPYSFFSDDRHATTVGHTDIARNVYLAVSNKVARANVKIDALAQGFTGSNSIPNGATTAAVISGATWDNAGIVPAAGGTSFTIPANVLAGTTFTLNASVVWTANTAGDRGVFFFVNGAQVSQGGAKQPPAAVGTTPMLVACKVRLNPGDVVDLRLYQASGAALTASFFFGITQN